ncbi:MAG: 2-amino-4-hydroxy-6-hydroxymethyldihydropteridine diphosphokinase [Comamonas sp.]
MILLADGDVAPPPGGSVCACIGLGANLGEPVAAMLGALRALQATPGVRLQAVSSLYVTAPIDSSGPDYRNAVAEVATSLSAHALLLQLQQLELQAGRERPYRNAPRTLDLDLLLYGDMVRGGGLEPPYQRIAMPDLLVPHPRMWERAFVLAPLAELRPDLVPAERLAAVAGQGVQQVRDGVWDGTVAQILQ